MRRRQTVIGIENGEQSLHLFQGEIIVANNMLSVEILGAPQVVVCASGRRELTTLAKWATEFLCHSGGTFSQNKKLQMVAQYAAVTLTKLANVNYVVKEAKINNLRYFVVEKEDYVDDVIESIRGLYNYTVS